MVRRGVPQNRELCRKSLSFNYTRVYAQNIEHMLFNLKISAKEELSKNIALNRNLTVARYGNDMNSVPGYQKKNVHGDLQAQTPFLVV